MNPIARESSPEIIAAQKNQKNLSSTLLEFTILIPVVMSQNVRYQKGGISRNSLPLLILLVYHHQNSTNAHFMVAEAVKAFEALAPVANPTKRLTASATGSRKWWRSARNAPLFYFIFLSQVLFIGNE
jgi:hypothetical protein